MKKQDICYNFIGTYQDDRFPAALDPSSAKIDNRSFEELIDSFISMAEKIRFFDKNPESTSLNWRPFFAQIMKNGKLDSSALHSLEESGEMQPHLALMLAFLKMYGIEQEGINSLTKRHLDFYYREMLRFAPKSGSVGNAVVGIKLSKNVRSAFIPAGTTFLAGKDNEGKNIVYSNIYDYTAYPATVEVMNVTGLNSADVTNANSNLPQCGFAISSPIFAVKGLESFDLNVESDKMWVLYTTKDGWKRGKISEKTIAVTPEEIVPYDDKTHQLGIETPYPVVFINFNSIDDLLSVNDIPKVKEAKVKIPSEDVIIRNKFGDLKNEEETQIFGPVPSVGDKCVVLAPDVDGYTSDVIIEKEIKLLGNAKSYVDINKNIITLIKDYGYKNYLKELITATSKIAKSELAEIPDAPKAPALSESMEVSCTYTSQKTQKYLCFLKTPIVNEAISNYNDLNIACSKGRHVYIGIRGIVPGSSLNMYLELDEAGELDVKENEEGPKWYVLKGNSWESADVSKDQTRGLQNNGIIYVEFNDSEIFRHHNILSEELVWLRLDYNDAKRPNVEHVTLNVVELEFDARSAGKGLKGAPLPKGSITKVEHSITGVKGVEQFRDGQDGEYAEDERGFLTRVSERLRHKGRAVTLWDYERLVLQEYPFIAAVKCIPYGVGSGKDTGTVTLIVVPKCTEKGNSEPKCSDVQLQKVGDFFKGKVSPFTKVKVENPSYEYIEIKCEICVHKGNFGIENNDYSKEIKNALVAYLAPWSDGNHGILMSNNYNESQIMLFLERLPYVDNVRNLRVSKRHQDGSSTQILEGEDITPKTSQGILTTTDKDIEIKIISN